MSQGTAPPGDCPALKGSLRDFTMVQSRIKSSLGDKAPGGWNVCLAGALWLLGLPVCSLFSTSNVTRWVVSSPEGRGNMNKT